MKKTFPLHKIYFSFVFLCFSALFFAQQKPSDTANISIRKDYALPNPTRYEAFYDVKTGMYYLRTKAAADAVKFTVDRQAIAETTPVTQNLEEKPLNYEAYAKEHTDKNKEAAAGFKMSEEEEKYAAMQCSLDNPEGCEMCGS